MNQALLALTLVALMPLPVSGAPGTAEVLARMSQAARSTRTLKGSFVQRKRLSLFDSEVTTRGKFEFRRPGWFRWETLPPDRSVLVIDGDKLTVSSGTSSRKVGLGEGMKAFLQDVMVWVGAKPASHLVDRYVIRLAKGQKSLTLTPKTSLRKRIRWISLHLDRDLIRQVVVMEKNGDRTTIAFEAVLRNQ